MKKLLSLTLAAAMLLAPLSSCRRDGGESDTPQAVMQTVDHVYSGAYISTPENIEPDADDAVLVGDTVIMPAYETLSRGDPETGEGYESRRILYAVPLNGGEATITPLPRKLTVTDTENESAYIGAVSVGTDGSYAVFESMYNRKNADRAYLLTLYAPDGAEIFSVDPEPMNEIRTGAWMPDDDYAGGYSFYIQRMTRSASGTLYIAAEFSVLALDSTGKKLYEVPVNGYVESMMSAADGRVLVSYRDYTDWEKHLCCMDDGKKSFGDPIALPGVTLTDYEIYLGEGCAYYLKTDTGLYGLNAPDAAPVMLCSWINSDIDPRAIRNLQVIDADTILYIGNDPVSYETELALLRRTPEEELQPRYLIRIAGVYFDYDFTGYVVKFNRRSDTYRVTLEDYSDYNTQGDYSAGEKKLKEDILAGNVPDILYASGYEEAFANYADKGVFADLYTLMDADTSFDKANLLSCVLEPFERDGKLYQMASSFGIAGFAGKTKNVGQYEGNWSLDTLLTLLDECEKNGTQFFSEMYREMMEQLLITYALPSYIDYENAVCDFTSDTFIRTLEFLKSLPTQEQFYGQESAGSAAVTITYDGNGYDYFSARQENAAALRDDKLLLTDLNMYSFSDYLQAKSVMRMEDITLLGVPTDGGGALGISGRVTYSIAAKSPVQTGAWEFVKYMLSDEVLADSERGGRYGFPATRTGMQSMAEAEMKMYYVFNLDGSGWSGTEWDGITPPDWEYDPETELPGYLTQADADSLMQLLESAAFLSDVNAGAEETLTALIAEELGAFYAGNSTAEATANKIQSRVGIYLSEKS